MVKLWINCLKSVLSNDQKDGSIPDIQGKPKSKRKESVVVAKIRKITSGKGKTCPELDECSVHSGSSSSFQHDKYRPDSSYSSQGGFEEEESFNIPTSVSISSFRSSDSAISTSSQSRARLTDNLPKAEPILDPDSQKVWILKNNKQTGLKIDTRGLPSERILNPLRSPTLTRQSSKLEVDGSDMTSIQKRLSEVKLHSSDELTPLCPPGNQDVFFSTPSGNPPREVESFYDYPKNNCNEDIYDIPANLKLSQNVAESDGMYSCSKDFQQHETIYDSPNLYNDDESFYDCPKNVIKNNESFYDSPKAVQEDTYDSPKQLKRENATTSNRVRSGIKSNESSPQRKSITSLEEIYDIPSVKRETSVDEMSVSTEKSLLEMIDESLYDTPRSILTSTSNGTQKTPPATEDEDLDGFYDTPSNILKGRPSSGTAQSITTNNSQLEAMILADNLYDTPRRRQTTKSSTLEMSSTLSSNESIQKLDDPVYDTPAKHSPPSRPVPMPSNVTVPPGLPPPRLPPRSVSDLPDRSSTLVQNKPPPLPNRISTTLPRGFVATPPQRPLPVPSVDLVEMSRTGPAENVSDRTLTREKRVASRESQIFPRTPQIPLNNYIDLPGPLHPATFQQTSPVIPPRDPAIPALPDRALQQRSNTNPFLPTYKTSESPTHFTSTPQLNFCKEVQEVYDRIDVDNSPDVVGKDFTSLPPSNNIPKYPVVQNNLAPKYPVVKNASGALSPKYPSMVKVKIGYQNVTDVKGALHRGGTNQGKTHKKLHRRSPQTVEDNIGYMPMKQPSERVNNPGPARTPPIPVPSVTCNQVSLPEDPYSYEKMESPEKRLLGNANYAASLQHHQKAATLDRSVYGNENTLNISRAFETRHQTLPSYPKPQPAFQNSSAHDFHHRSAEDDQMAEPAQDYLLMSSNNQTEYLNFEGVQPSEYLQMGANDPAEYLNFGSDNHLFSNIQFEDAHQSDF